MATLWTAFDTTTLSTNTEAGLVVGVGLTLAFLAYKLIKRVSSRI